MKARLTQSYVASIKSPDKPYWITDTGCPKLRLHVGTSSKVWYVGYRGNNGNYVNHKIGTVDEFTVAEAREAARDFAVSLKRGEIHLKEKSKKKLLLGEFMDNTYASWRRDNHKAAQATLNMLKSQFGELFYSRPIDELKLSEFYAWRSSRLEQGKKATTVNKNIVALKAALKWGVKQGYIESNPLEKMELLKEYDSEAKVRYLSDDERQRLMTALDDREKRIRAGRTNHNEWLDERERPLMPEFIGEFADHIKPMVLLSLHTGMRQGNLFALKWGNIDFESRTATLRAAVTKTGKTVRIPLNSFSMKLLSDWRIQCANATPDALVFPSPVSGAILTNVKKAWSGVLQAAQIENFRWHDMRHDFASQLVMRGVDLNTVRELMGHADMQMTMRYAHLAPSIKLQAVELLAKS